MKLKKGVLIYLSVVMGILPAFSQTVINVMDSSSYQPLSTKEKDMIDILKNWFSKTNKQEQDVDIAKKIHLSGVPAAGYTLGTGFAAVISANGAFYTNKDANTSTILTSITYTEKSQIIFPIQTNIWTKNNKFNVNIDWRYLKYPSFTYGLGDYTSLNDGYMIDYSTIHLHQTVMRKILYDLFIGGGYNIDYYWNIKELNPPGNKITDFENYGFANKEFASGFTINFLFDNRKNSINPQNGNYVNIIYHPNLTIFGNTTTWRSLVIDTRKYINFPNNTENVFAFWSYNWFTLSGKPPYLMLPNTGGDPFSNTGRGYVQGRFRGNNMVYLESEYRFKITINGLIGGVLFGNLQSFTYPPSNRFQLIHPGWGGGLRVKINKHSGTNVAIDYGFGAGGSGGVFVNLGEVF